MKIFSLAGFAPVAAAKMDEHFISSLSEFLRRRPNAEFALAVSGGADSMAMLHWMKNAGPKVCALTVDHCLRSGSRAEAEFVAAECRRLGVSHETLEWCGEKPATGIEEAARQARYGLMTRWCRDHGVGVLCVAHQADDQIETFFMNLSRGSGVYGLAGMREISDRDGIVIFRPLLGVSRAVLRAYCDLHNIKYFDDPMNDDEKFLRVRIRRARRLLPVADERILLAIGNLARAREFLLGESDRLARRILQNNPIEFDADLLLNKPDEIRYRAMSAVLGGAYPLRLAGIRRAFARLDKGEAKITLGGRIIELRRGKIRIRSEHGDKDSKHSIEAEQSRH